MKHSMRGVRGFTLAELLIVVGIISVLLSIAIPVFASQMERVKQTTDIANARAAYSVAASECITGMEDGLYYFNNGQLTMTRPTNGYGKSRKAFKSFYGYLPVDVEGYPCDGNRSNYLTLRVEDSRISWMRWGSFPLISTPSQYMSASQAQREQMDVDLITSIRDVVRNMTYREILNMFGTATKDQIDRNGQKVEKWTGTCYTLAISYINIDDGTINTGRNQIFAENLFQMAGYSTGVGANEAYLFTSWAYGTHPTYHDDLKIKVEIGKDISTMSDSDLDQKARDAYVYINGNGLPRTDPTFGHERDKKNR